MGEFQCNYYKRLGAIRKILGMVVISLRLYREKIWKLGLTRASRRNHVSLSEERVLVYSRTSKRLSMGVCDETKLYLVNFPIFR